MGFRSNGLDVSNYTQVEESLNKIYIKEGKINDIINTTGILEFLNCKE